MTSTYPNAPVIDQVSPRIGFAYQLGGQAVLHFSYGHFFQMPPLYAMYQNHSYLIPPNDYGTTMGNVLLKPEKTITYEIGLWQELTRGMGLDVALFYRDIYNLLSTKIISTYNQIEYGLYSNKDYGNARGLEVKLDLGYGSIKGMVNYTLQYTRGNADYPTQTFDRAGNNMDPVNRFIPMSWDQRHTLNGTVMFFGKNYGGTFTAYYNSGSPYTFSPQSESVLSRINLYPNNAYKPSTTTVDATLYYNFKLLGRLHGKVDLTIYNLLDRLNEEWVDGQTGRAYTAVIRETDLAGHRSDFNDYEDRIKNPSMFSGPRMMKLAVGINF
jgi:outer membrane receptor protein involved in Fe transport